VGQELLAEVEAPAADHVAVDVPADALRDLDAPGIAPGVQRRRSQLLLSHVHRAHSSRSRVGSVLPRAASNGSTTARGAVCERKVFARFPRRNAVLPLCMGRRAPLYSVAPRPQAPGALRRPPIDEELPTCPTQDACSWSTTTPPCARCSPGTSLRPATRSPRSEEHTSELQSRENLV